MSPARPPEGARTVARQGEGTPVRPHARIHSLPPGGAQAPFEAVRQEAFHAA
jgi:hypothetical protein